MVCVYFYFVKDNALGKDSGEGVGSRDPPQILVEGLYLVSPKIRLLDGIFFQL